jgi:phosphate transport system substrate-binding protein
VKARIGKVLAVVAVLALGAIALTGCGGASTSTSPSASGTNASSAPAGQASGSLNISGSDTMVNMAQAWAEAYGSVNSNAAITVKGGGSGNGIAALINKTVDFADSSREIKPEEVTQAQANGVTPVTTEVARDGVVIIVNSGNKVSDISKEQLGKVYAGQITNWKDLGGADAHIVLLGRDSSSGTYAFINDEVLAKLPGKPAYAKSMRNLQSSQAIVDEVSKNPNAIGYVGLGYENKTIKALTVGKVAASVTTVLDSTYPLSRGLNMISNGDPTGLADAYLQWILGPDGQKIVKDQGFVPLSK